MEIDPYQKERSGTRTEDAESRDAASRTGPIGRINGLGRPASHKGNTGVRRTTGGAGLSPREKGATSLRDSLKNGRRGIGRKTCFLQTKSMELVVLHQRQNRPQLATEASDIESPQAKK